MDSTTVRTRIEAIWNLLPTVFTTRDVLVRARMSKDQGSTVRVILDAMVDEGLLYHSMVAEQKLGRKPTAWSKERSYLRDDVLAATIRSVLPRMPVKFTVDDLLAAIGMSQRMTEKVCAALARLAASSTVLRVTDTPSSPGRHTDVWTADPRTIADEIDFKQRKAIALAASGSQASGIDRMFRPWDPFADDKESSVG